MHFFKTSVGFIAVMCAFGASYSATSSRVSVTAAAAAASRRLPVLSNLVKTGGSTTTTTTTTGTTSSSGTILLSDADCIEDYRDCMKGDNACGSEFEECTTNVLFHGHMGECFSTLYQCPNSAVQSLFGTSNIGALSNVESYVADTNNTEVARYTYPTDGSIMGIDIIGAATRNKLSTADCVKKYKRCLNKDTVCGEDFELCTSKQEFKKQAVLCDSTLSRCQKEGFQQIFGAKVTTKPANKRLEPDGDGDAAKWIEDGATLAAANAVNTCYKVVDNCFMNACAKNPYRCVEGINIGVINSAEFVSSQETGATNVQFTSMNNNDEFTNKETTTVADVRKFFRAACEETIGANKYCQMTFLGRMPKKSELQGEDAVELYEEVFDDAYATRNNKNILGEKVTQLIEKFDTSAKNKCVDTFKSCAVRSCGGGSGAVCYNRVFGASGTKSIAAGNPYQDVKTGCEGVVNMDANCVYMSAVQGTGAGTSGTYNYTFSNDGAKGAFATLFPEKGDTVAITALDADLSTAYNSVAIEGMKKQCQNLVENCVKSMCGKDYQNCYRHRTDVALTTYNTGNSKFDKSMNEIRGVLDYTVVQGLCAGTIRNADACAESLAIAKAGIADGEADVTAGWGNNLTTVNNAWRNSASMATGDGLVNDVDSNGKRRCECANNIIDICADESGATDMTCTKAHRVTRNSLMENQAVATLFQDILAIVEQEAQAQYKAKITKEQNVCLAQNTGSAMSNEAQTFVWAALPKDYSLANSKYELEGLTAEQAKPSNNLYGSFCRVKVTLMSDDADVQKLLSGGTVSIQGNKASGMFGIDWLAKDQGDKTGNNAIKGVKSNNAYFAVGDPFTCGSWMSADALDKISEMVDFKARKDAGEGSQKAANTRLWTTLGVGALGGVGSFIGMNALQTNGSSLGGLLKKSSSANSKVTDAQRTAANQCVSAYEGLKSMLKDNETLTGCTDTTVVHVGVKVNDVTGLEGKISDMKGYAIRSGIGANIPEFATQKCTSSIEYYTNMKDVKEKLEALRNSCDDRAKAVETADDRSSRLTNNLIAGAAGAVVTGALANGITRSVQKANYEEAGNTAVKEWMEKIGSKIHCYVGAEMVGDFGDIISINISED